MFKWKALCLSCALAATSAGAWAGPSLMGGSGNLLVPNTETAAVSTLAGSGSVLWVDRNGSTKANQCYALTFGAAPNLEVGFARAEYKTTSAEGNLFQVKYRVTPEKGLWPSLAVGSLDLTNELGAGEATAYAVVSRKLWSPVDEFTGDPVMPLRGYLGYGTGIYGNSPFYGADWQFANNTKLILEYSKNTALGDSEYLFNLGVQAAITKNLVVSGAAVDMRHPSLSLSYVTDKLIP